MSYTIKPFKRGISNEDFIDALNKLREDSDSYWSKMVNDPELFIAIRDEYVSVYFYGQSLCKLEFKKGKVIGKTHKKYLGVEKDRYFIFEDGVIKKTADVAADTISNLSEINSIKENMQKHIGREKRESYKVILDSEINVLDSEITFVKKLVDNPTKHGDYEQSSIDYLVLEGNTLVFYEAKHYKNPEIRSQTEPKVVSQISRYEEALNDHEEEVIKTYGNVLQNLNDLGLSDVKLENIKVDREARLIVFGVPEDTSNDKHVVKLRDKYNDRLILK